MSDPSRKLTLPEFEQHVCDVVARHLGLSRERVHPHSRLSDEFGSLDIIELMMVLEDDAANLALDNRGVPPVSIEAVLSRSPITLGDLALVLFSNQWDK